MTPEVPNPGSDAAIEQGCICPRMDNARGRGWMGGVRDEQGRSVFVIRGDCPLHGVPDHQEGRRG